MNGRPRVSRRGRIIGHTVIALTGSLIWVAIIRYVLKLG